MSDSGDSSLPPARRRVLAILINGFVTIVGGGLSALLGVFALRPASAASRERWVRAAVLADLTANVPVPRVLTVSRVDGWYRERARQTVFLVWDGAKQVRALSATCTHLGCQVHWDTKASRFRCPCHGGVYDASGQVLSGPPPRPLDSIVTRVDGADDAVLVRL